MNFADADNKMLGECPGDYAGVNVRGVGDVDGDGQDDIAVWAADADPGVVYVVQHTIVGAESIGEAEGSLSVTGKAGVGVSSDTARLSMGADMDGDGYSDLLVGTPSGEGGEGWVWILHGPVVGALDLSEVEDNLYGNDGDQAGGGVAWLGDMNEDGWEDILVGAVGLDGAESSLGYCATPDHASDGDEGGRAAGGAYVFVGPVSGSMPASVADARLYGEDGYDYAGEALTHAGDLNGDGTPDLLLPAFNNCEMSEDAGAAYVLYGPVVGDVLLADADAKWMGESYEDQAGESLALAGDVNGDGLPDLLVGSPDRDSGRGNAYLILGPTMGKAGLGEADAILTGEAIRDGAGSGLAGAGDINGDGFEDLLIGAYHESSISSFGGAAYVVFGPVTGLHDLGGAAGKFAGPAGAAGVSVANAGDIDGDGFTDLLVGAYGDDDAGERAGAVYVLLGNGKFLNAIRGVE